MTKALRDDIVGGQLFSDRRLDQVGPSVLNDWKYFVVNMGEGLSMTGTATDIFRWKSMAGVALCAGVTLVLSSNHGQAQAVEQHPAVPLRGQLATSLNAADFVARPGDPTPFGVDLKGLLIVDGHANGGKIVAHGATSGVDTTFGGPTAQNDALRKVLASYVGQPLSFKLLSEIQTVVTQFYRVNGRSLVSVTVPQQEITSGVVQINVTAFVLAAKQVQGADAASTAYLQRNIRLQPGQEVDTNRLLADVNWLNQNPFRHVAVQFEPGQGRDTTIMTLQVQSGRPWSGYVGASNTGSDATGIWRLYGGFNISPLAWNDQQLSYQFTGAPESVGVGNLWDTNEEKGYLSHAMSYLVPITTNGGFRTRLTVSASHISSYSEPGGVFTSGAATTVLDAEMAIPLPKTSGHFAFVPEVYAKLEHDDYNSFQYFVGIPFAQESTKLTQLTLGLRGGVSGQLFGKSSRGNIDLGLVYGKRDTDGFDASNYSFAKLTLNEEVFVNAQSSVAMRLTGQVSGDKLHPLNQLDLGGDSTVRGYEVNGVAGSTAFAASLEYRAPSIDFAVGDQDGKFHPHIFADFGLARKDAPFEDQDMRSIGLGGQFEVGNGVVGTVDLAQALTDAGTTEANSTSVAFQMTVRF